MEENNGLLSCNSLADWQEWLKQNHESECEIWLKLYKKSTGKQVFSITEAMEVALCYGWIDSRVQNIDSESYAYRFTPRRKNSKWSEKNKLRVIKLISEGKMQKPGLKYADWLSNE